MNHRRQICLILVFMLGISIFAGINLFAQNNEYHLSIVVDGVEYKLFKGFYRELIQDEVTSLTLDPVPVGWIEGRKSYIMASSYTMTSDEVETILGYGGFVPMFQEKGSLAYITVNGTAVSGKAFTGELFFMHITESSTMMVLSYDLEIRFDTVDDLMIGTFSGNMVGMQGKPQTPGSYLMTPGKGSFIVKAGSQ